MLGLSTWSLAVELVRVLREDLVVGRASPTVGWVLMGLATIFATLWLSEIVPVEPDE